MPSANKEYDIIFVGGGTAACLIAGRLATADPSLKILLVEAGPHTKDDLAHTQPARYLSHLAPTSKTVKFVVSKEVPQLGRSVVVPCGQCVGGGSSVNFVMYTRGAASDYDDWETKYGNPGWGSKDLIPLFKKTETYQVASGKDTHGYSGPLKVSYGGAFSNIGQEFLEVGAKYDTTRGKLEDPNSLFDINGYGRWQKWIDGETGKRSDVPHHFVYNQSHNKNLEILAEHLVKRVIFEGNRAVGVEYLENKNYITEATGEIFTARATRLVVVSSGPFGSPVLLERSGIGAKDLLEKHGVKVLVDLPGVGDKYQDHQVIFPPYNATEESDTLDGIVRNNASDVEKWTAQWNKDGSGLMSHNALDAGVKIRPSDEELKQIGPDFAARWKEHFVNSPDKPVMWMGPVSMLVGDWTTSPNCKYFSLGYFVEYPSSFGHVHLTSGEDVYADYDFDPGYLKTADDLAVLKWGYKRSREFARRLKSYRGEFTPSHPVFPKDSAAVTSDDNQPSPIEAENIDYTEEDEKAIVEFTRKFVATAWHSLGTCAMKPREQGGVVDSALNVYGVEGLKVCDLSVAPGNVGANTYSTALVIAEKAAVIIGEQLGIKGV